MYYGNCREMSMVMVSSVCKSLVSLRTIRVRVCLSKSKGPTRVSKVVWAAQSGRCRYQTDEIQSVYLRIRLFITSFDKQVGVLNSSVRRQRLIGQPNSVLFD